MDLLNISLPLVPSQIRDNPYQYLSALIRELERYILVLSVRDMHLDKRVHTQATPTAKTTAATLTAAELLTGLITGTHTAGATQAYTLPTGTLMDEAVGFDLDHSFDWVLVNLSTGANTITLTASTDHTIVGNAVVAITSSSVWRTRKTAVNTFVTYRIA